MKEQKSNIKTLHAFFVAINEYPRYPLNGCVNDMQYFKNHLETYFQSEEMHLRSKVLIDGQATRKAIIEGFQHFQAAKDGDICVFFYAGHGSHWKAPEAFWHLEPDKENESIVCVDSRVGNGRDIMDKELSYLIWEATNGKEIHFVVITDCCHSGSITRGQKERQISGRQDAIPVEEYHGFPHYKKVGEKQYSPPRGRYIHLAASQDKQTAKEVYVKEKPCGIFTYALVEALSAFRNQISYEELMSRAGIRVGNAVKDQSPQLDASQTEDKSLLFLSEKAKSEAAYYLVAYRKNIDWTIDAGAIHGILLGDGEFKTLLKLESNHQTISVEKVLANYATVKGMENYDKKKTYKATLLQRAIPKFPIAFAENSDEQGIALIKKAISEKKTDLFQIVAERETAQYWIHAKKEFFYLTTPHFYDNALFKRVQGFHQKASIEFLNNIERILKWVQVLKLENPERQIRDDEVLIEIFRVTDPGNETDDAPVELLEWNTVFDFPYQYKAGQWHKPALQLKITNTSNRTLWCSMSYMGDDFSITNQLLQKQRLNPGEYIWAADIFEGHPYRTISLEMKDHYHKRGITSIDEYLKLFICTEEFSTDQFNQEGLEPDVPQVMLRSYARRSKMKEPVQSWDTRELHLRIMRLGEANN